MKKLSETFIKAKYGKGGDESNLITIQLPYPMKLAWDTKTKITSIRCHKLIATDLTNVFKDILATYGLPKIQELGIDLYGGCYNFRLMRGGSSLSRHSWGIAIDLHPEANGLKTPFSKALFSKPEYKELHEAFEKHGFINLGKVYNYDTMHWEIAK